MKKIFLCLVGLVGCCAFTTACSYLRTLSTQVHRESVQETHPSQRNAKHLLKHQTTFMHGFLKQNMSFKLDNLSMAVAAYSNKFKDHELVDITHFAQPGTYYGLNLPDGTYELLVLADIDKNGFLEGSEVVGYKKVKVSSTNSEHNTLGGVDILLLAAKRARYWDLRVRVPHIKTPYMATTIYPKGSIRKLSDPIFRPTMSKKGLYDPVTFLEKAPLLFYALEPDKIDKRPLIFVHGIDGSPRQFNQMIANVDLKKYKVWLYYYPSGEDLNKISQIFYNLFLSGKVIKSNNHPLTIVAHSMGGLVVREALNIMMEQKNSTKVNHFISIATPFDGVPSAADGEESSPVVLPVWRDMNPKGPFIKKLFRTPLSKKIKHHLIFAIDNPDAISYGNNSDGSVPVASQLRQRAQDGAYYQRGYNFGHVEVLNNPILIDYLLNILKRDEN